MYISHLCSQFKYAKQEIKAKQKLLCSYNALILFFIPIIEETISVKMCFAQSQNWDTTKNGNQFLRVYVYIHRFVHCSISIYYISSIFRSVHTTAFLYVVDFGKHINHYFWLVALRYKGIILLSCLTRSLITHFLHSRYNIVFCNEMLLSMLYMFESRKSLHPIFWILLNIFLIF